MDRETRLRATAFHEAGHAVMGWHCGARFRSVTIRARRGCEGAVWFCGALQGPRLREPGGRERAALIYLAGPMAAWPHERRFRAASARDDLEHAYDLVRLCAASPEDARARWSALRERAWNVLAEDHLLRAVTALAETLLVQGTLTGKAARALIARACADRTCARRTLRG
jgi:hypothetical protein